MGPKKKKQPKNAFYFFMCEWKEEKEEEGYRFPGGLKEVSSACQEDWQNLPSNLMERYKRMEKDAKLQDKTDLNNKFTSTGKSYKEVLDEQMEAQAFEDRMNNEIATIMEESKRNMHVLKSRCFYLIHCNVYIYWGEKKQWVPCEVAISEFNLIDGLRRVYHVFPGVLTTDGKLPLGYKLESRQRRETVHYIPDPEDFDRIESNYDKIYENLTSFLMPNGGKVLPPLFTMEDDSNTNNNMTAIRDFLKNVAGDEDIDFRVYSLPLFFFHLRNTCFKLGDQGEADEEGFPYVGLASQQLERDYYNFHEELACDFHATTEGFTNCSLSVVKRWVFLVCEFCCPDINLPMKPGRHCVKTAKINALASYTTNSETALNEAEGWMPVSKPSHSSGPVATSSTVSRPVGPPARPTEPAGSKSSASRPTSQSSTPSVGAGSADGPGGYASRGQLVWGRGVTNMASENLRNPSEDRRPGQVLKPIQQVSRPGIPTSSMAGLTIVDYSKGGDPSQMRTYKTGQSPNVVSEIFPDEGTQDNLRMPSTRGRGETLAMAMACGRKETPGPNFTEEDFPAVGAFSASSGKPQRPIASAWGRGLSFGPK